jgi:ABC-type uncharacterized transport system auxiliary subunit
VKYALLLVLAACAGKVPETRYYQLAAPIAAQKQPASVSVAVEPLAADAAYDDDRIVYRLTPYRLDYYNYQRWSSPPGTMIANYLQDVLAKSGRFRAVMHEPSDSVPVTLGGRVVALEEVDRSKTQWIGHVVVELTLTDTVTNKVLWAQQYDESEPLKEQTPEGLAQAISIAMARITQSALPTVAEIAEQQQKVHEAKLVDQRADHGDHRQ